MEVKADVLIIAMDGHFCFAETARMADDLDWIREGLKKPGKTQTGIAAALKRAPSAVTALLKGDRELKAREIRVIADYLEVEPPAFEPEGVPIVGLVGAGPDGSVVFSEGDGELGFAPVPPGWTESTVAVEVRGDSMRGIALDGWLVYYDDRKGILTPEMLGEPCIIGLADGRVLMKIPYEGRDGLFDLVSSNQVYDVMRDQVVEWASLVTAIVPRKPAKRLATPKGEAIA